MAGLQAVAEIQQTASKQAAQLSSRRSLYPLPSLFLAEHGCLQSRCRFFNLVCGVQFAFLNQLSPIQTLQSPCPSAESKSISSTRSKSLTKIDSWLESTVANPPM